MNVIDKRKLDDNLEVWLVDRGHEYATYIYNKDLGGTVSGHYFSKDEEDAARRDFETRS